ncbi:scavenger receptor cysteine-rich type 1 protein M130-like [Thunnus thynnus]|uniref:scavenger receptor cysteine-rich type 1 protein M130-like n=1 Tax=Thunnus thynnus TaxID=8237 RepID=UPI0035299626
MRADSQRIAVLIIDEVSYFGLYKALRRLRDIGIEIYIIGVKTVNEGLLRNMASDPAETHMFRVSDSSFLLDIVDNVTINLCNSAVDSVRLVDGTSLCSGRLEVKSEQSWSSVCEADFDQQDAEVVCRELGCGAPSVLQGALYGELEAPMWTKEFQCGGHESALLDCGRSDSARSTCSPGKAVGLTCSEPVRLVGGASRCAGTLEMKQGEWRPMRYSDWTMKEAAVACRVLDCGSAVSTGIRNEPSKRSVWSINHDCVQSGSSLRDCASSSSSSRSSSIIELTCSDSVRLVNGTSLCSGRLEVKSEQLWSSVCEADFDQQDAEVVCRELGCEAPSVLQGALYGEVEAPMWTKEFQCGGHESALLDCGRSDSARSTCSPGKAVGLTCSEPVRLVGGASRCAGTLEVEQGEWRPVWDSYWTLKEAAVACRVLDCGSAVSSGNRKEPSKRSVWKINHDCVQSGSALRDCASSYSFSFIMELTCSVRLFYRSGIIHISISVTVNLPSNSLNPRLSNSWSRLHSSSQQQEVTPVQQEKKLLYELPFGAKAQIVRAVLPVTRSHKQVTLLLCRENSNTAALSGGLVSILTLSPLTLSNSRKRRVQLLSRSLVPELVLCVEMSPTKSSWYRSSCCTSSGSFPTREVMLHNPRTSLRCQKCGNAGKVLLE